MSTELTLGQYKAGVDPIGYVEVDNEVWNSASLLGCGGNVIVNVETIVGQLDGEEGLSESEEKLLEICKAAKDKGIGDLILYI